MALLSIKNYQFEYGYHRFIYKKDFIKKQGILFPDLSYYEDPVFFVTAMSEAKKISMHFSVLHIATERCIKLLYGVINKYWIY